ncbi:DNA/RNA helicase [Streptococcus sp. X16XC17]|nr:DNA/RNA helicase [Streptococcus sp. X16XC17]
MINLEDLYGRWFTKHQLTAEERALAQELSPQQDRCHRCATPYQEEYKLPNDAYYCRECILLGRIRSDEPLYYFPQQDFPKQDVLKWKGQLTPYQTEISEGLYQQIQNNQATLVHAVTGAGKTEMMYQAVAQIIENGGAVCLASPRIDVCIELYKRLQKEFSCPISLLHGESKPYFRTPLAIATTHQLLKFYHAFDLLLIDEVDAFPYVDNPMLYHAVENALKPEGVPIFLTATSTDELDKMVGKGRLVKLQLLRRFHGNPLIVPKKIWMQSFQASLAKNTLPTICLESIRKQRISQFPLLVFAPQIKTGQQIKRILEQFFPDETIGLVSSQTEERLEMVEKFRQGEIKISVATTILEGGVTFPCVDVFVFEAHHRLYNSSSLVQISGRVGRSMDRPTGNLFFFIEETNHAIEKSIQEIKDMNKEAGYAKVHLMPRGSR